MGALADERRGLRAPWFVGAVAAVLILASCAATGTTAPDARTATTAPTSTTPTLPDPPWRAEPPLPATGFNRAVLDDFNGHSAKGTCPPMGLDTDVWTPPAGHEWYFVYNFYTDPVKYSPDEQVAVLVERAVDWQEWSDGSVTVNSRLLDGTYRFDLHVPTVEPGMWCTYIYDPTTKDFASDGLIDAIRFLEIEPAGAG